MSSDTILASIVAGVLFVVVLAALASSRYRKVGPNKVMIIYGRKHRYRDLITGEYTTRGFKMVKGGGAFIWPIVETWQDLSFELMTLDIKTPSIYTVHGVPVLIEAVAQIKVKGDDTSIITAAEQFLGKRQDHITASAMHAVEGHLRAIVGTMDVEEIVTNWDQFAERVQEVSAVDLANMGLQVISFVIKDIKDTEGYLDAWGRPRIAMIKRDAAIAEAEAERDAAVKSATAGQTGLRAKFESDTSMAEIDRDYKIQLAEYNSSVQQKMAETDLAYDLQKFKTQQLVKKEEIQVQVIEKQKQIEVQEQEILRREKELAATIQRPAEAERSKIQQLAEAEKYKLQATAAGQAEAEKVIGLAEADVTRAKGDAEAFAMTNKAEAWQQYNEAAMLQIVTEKLPELARAVSEPLSKTDKIIVIGGSDGSAGASKVTQDVVNVIAQLPTIIQAMTGVDLHEVMKRIPERTTKAESAPEEHNVRGKHGHDEK